MRFDEAFATVSKHKNVYMALPWWSDDVKVFCQFPRETYPGNRNEMTHKFLFVESRFGRVPWLPTQVELFSDEWKVRGI